MTNISSIKKTMKVLCIFMMILNVLEHAQVFAANQMPTDSYSFRIISAPLDTIPPYTLGHLPARGAQQVSTNSNIILRIKDDGAGVDRASIKMTVNDQIVSPVITGTPSEYTLTYNPSAEFINGQEVFVTIDAKDLAP